MLSFEFPFRQRLNYSVSTWLQKVSWGGNKVRKEKMLFYTCEDNPDMIKEMLNDSDFSSEYFPQSVAETVNMYVEFHVHRCCVTVYHW